MPRTRADLHTATCARAECGKQFFQRTPGQEYCSQKCSNIAFPGTGGRKPAAGLEPRICPVCRTEYQPYRANQMACSRQHRAQLPEVSERENARRRTPEHRERKNKWRRETPAQVTRGRADNRKRQLAKYGLTPGDYERMLAEQGGRCMLCGRLPKPGGIKAASKLHADHDHRTGKNRDLLCGSCNQGLGYFGDDPVLLRAAAEYIERHRNGRDLMTGGASSPARRASGRAAGGEPEGG